MHFALSDSYWKNASYLITKQTNDPRVKHQHQEMLNMNHVLNGDGTIDEQLQATIDSMVKNQNCVVLDGFNGQSLAHSDAINPLQTSAINHVTFAFDTTGV